MTATVHTGRLNGTNIGGGPPVEFTHTNSTGGNVRIIFYWLYSGNGSGGFDLRWGDLSDSNLFNYQNVMHDVVAGKHVYGTVNPNYNLPTEIVLADGNGVRIKADNNANNIMYHFVAIPE